MNRRLLASLTSFAVLAVLGFFTFGILLGSVWERPSMQPIMRASAFDPTATIAWLITIAIISHLLDHFVTGFWFEKQKDANKLAWQYGLAVGIVFCLPSVSNFFYFNLPIEVPVANVLYALIAFPLAALAYAKVYGKK